MLSSRSNGHGTDANRAAFLPNIASSAGRSVSTSANTTGSNWSGIGAGSIGPLSARGPIRQGVTSFPSVVFDRVSSQTSIASTVKLQDWDAPLASLRQSDLASRERLRADLEKLKLSEYFDHHGSLQFQRLGLTFAAKQIPQVGQTFGSWGEVRATSKLSNSSRAAKIDLETEENLGKKPDVTFCARSWLAASEAVAKDAVQTKSRAQEFIRRVIPTDVMRVADVEERRLQLLFEEVSDFERFIPDGVQLEDLLPVDLGYEEELRTTNIAERQNHSLEDPHWHEGLQMGWSFDQTQAIQLANYLECWCEATRGLSSPRGMDGRPLGMDRPTFCKFLVDCNLLENDKVPYFWMVQLFDSLVQPMRCCAQGVTWAATASVTPAVNRWRLISLMDVIARQLCAPQHQYELLARVKQAARHHLPPGTELPASRQPSLLEAEEADQQDKEGTLIEGPKTPRLKEYPRYKTITLVKKPDAESRDRMLLAMLLEPEVLHLTFKYQALFRLLFECYSTQEGHMDFPELLHFCTDFHLTPRFVSENTLKAAYEAAQCSELDVPKLAPVPESAPTVTNVVKLAKPTRQGSPVKSPVKRREAKMSTTSLKTGGSPLQSGSFFKRTRAPSDMSRSSSVMSSQDLLSDSRAGSSASVMEPSPPEVEARFGANAFLETICKVIFLHLGFYGNSVQQSSNAYYRIVWLLCYLRYVCYQLHGQQARLDTPLDGPLGKALEAIPMSFWESPPPPCHKGPFRATTLQPPPGPGFSSARLRRPKQQECFPRLKPARPEEDVPEEHGYEDHRRAIAEGARQVGALSAVILSSNKTRSHENKSGCVQESDEDDAPVHPFSLHAQGKPGADEFMLESLKSKEDIKDVLLGLEVLLKIEAGKQCIEHQTCRICGSRLAGEANESSWKRNNEDPHCRGCSATDMIRITSHPFAALLRRTVEDVPAIRPKAKSYVGSRFRPALPLPVDDTKKSTLRSEQRSSALFY